MFSRSLLRPPSTALSTPMPASSSIASSLPMRMPARTVVHHARPPRRPRQPTPYSHLRVTETAGTSRPNPDFQPSAPEKVVLSDSGLEFYHAPPPTDPVGVYSSGMEPQWLAGNAQVDQRYVNGLPRTKQGTAGAEMANPEELATQLLGEKGSEMVQEMIRLREQDPRKWSRKKLIERFSLPASASPLIARVAPTPSTRRLELESTLEAKKQGWGFKKRLAREIREVRKGHW